MKNLFLAFCTCLNISAFAQRDIRNETDQIVAEGKELYRSEMASWYGTDLFMEHYDDKENIGGYFSYTEGGISKCIFFSKGEKATVIGTISFDSTYNTKTAKVDLNSRAFTGYENELYRIRKAASELLDNDTTVKRYSNTNLNLIPFIYNKERKAYILTGPQKTGVVLFGNDYLLVFDKNSKLLSKKEIHRNLIPVEYDMDKSADSVVGTVHSHLPETGEFITATDICTLMLYGKFAKWKQHCVVSKNYMSIWNCETNVLTIIPLKSIGRNNSDKEAAEQKNEK